MYTNASLKGIATFLIVVIALTVYHKKIRVIPSPQTPAPVIPETPLPEPSPTPPSISIAVPDYLDYDGVNAQLNKWHSEAKDFTEVGSIGKTTKGKEIMYIRVTDLRKTGLPKILVTGCIHGNEPHATSTVMGYIGSLLDGYWKETEVTKIIGSRDIYFIPILSPDSYPRSRYVDGVDPNRDYENKRSAPVVAVENFFESHKFKAAWSGHTWGRVFLTPYGDKTQLCPDDAKFKRVIGEMGKLANYRVLRACELYNAGGGLNNPPIRYGENGWMPQAVLQPIYGTEVDWYYKNGAFAIVCEYGTHQRIPSSIEIQEEFERTWKAFLYFCVESIN